MDRRDPFGWIGKTIEGKYSIESMAGEGAFGVVYRGRHLGFDEPIAVKCLKLPDALEDVQAKVLATFQNEARILHRLSRQTTGIVQALDVGAATAPSNQWTPFIVMEWLEGESLEVELKRRRDGGGQARTLAQAIDLLSP